jgi:hypothetical protein
MRFITLTSHFFNSEGEFSGEQMICVNVDHISLFGEAETDATPDKPYTMVILTNSATIYTPMEMADFHTYLLTGELDE